LKGNDLSNVVTPRLVLVFEGALGFLPEARVRDFNYHGSRGNWRLAWQEWELDDLAMRKIWDVTFRQSFQLEVVTYVAPEEGAPALAERLEEESLPITRVTASTPARMARRLAYAPDVAYVYDANRENAFKYGSRGGYLRSIHQLGR
jgi:hypothetical protein